MTEYIEIQILKEECFVCFDSHESEYITLKCCNRHNIHKKCLFNIFLNYLQYPIAINIQNSIISCPLCRQEISIKDYFTLDECITLFMKCETSYRQKFSYKFNAIITYNYIEVFNQIVVSVDETESIIVKKSSYKKFALTIILFVLLILVIIGLKFIYS
jgi:hypothetical protein